MKKGGGSCLACTLFVIVIFLNLKQNFSFGVFSYKQYEGKIPLLNFLN